MGFSSGLLSFTSILFRGFLCLLLSPLGRQTPTGSLHVLVLSSSEFVQVSVCPGWCPHLPSQAVVTILSIFCGSSSPVCNLPCSSGIQGLSDTLLSNSFFLAFCSATSCPYSFCTLSYTSLLQSAILSPNLSVLTFAQTLLIHRSLLF